MGGSYAGLRLLREERLREGFIGAQSRGRFALGDLRNSEMPGLANGMFVEREGEMPWQGFQLFNDDFGVTLFFKDLETDRIGVALQEKVHLALAN